MPAFDRALDFIVRADMFGSRYEQSRLGTVVSLPELPLRHDSNYLALDALPPATSAAEIAAEAEAWQAGLTHRSVLFRRTADGDRLAPDLRALGWTTFGGLVMQRTRAVHARGVGTRVERVDLEAIRTAREALTLTHPWATPEVARQLSWARRYAPVETRHYAVFEEGAAVAWLDVLLDGDVAQLEELATVEGCRGRGHARALMEHALAEVDAAGAGFVFLCADANDWPRTFYGRLGFEEIGRYVKCTKL